MILSKYIFMLPQIPSPPDPAAYFINISEVLAISLG